MKLYSTINHVNLNLILVWLVGSKAVTSLRRRVVGFGASGGRWGGCGAGGLWCWWWLLDVGRGNVALTIPLLPDVVSSTIWLLAWLVELELVFEMAELLLVLFGVKVIMRWSSSPPSSRSAAVVAFRDAFRGGGAGGVVALDCCMAAAAACWRKWV